MFILDRYIGIAVIGGTLLVLGVLMALFSFIAFLSELESVGQAGYGLFQAMQFVLMMTPRMAYQLLPLSALLVTPLLRNHSMSRPAMVLPR